LKRTPTTDISSVNSREIDESKFSIQYRNDLNDAQYEAVSSVDGSYLIIAGAGTGKTRTLVYRVARLVEMGYDPTTIVLLTFTRKAAAEMLHRAELLLDKRCSRIQGGTFHSFANTTLRRYASLAGLNPNFTILDQGDSEDVVSLVRSQIPAAEKSKRFPNKSTLHKIFSFALNTCRPIDDVVFMEYPQFFNDIDKIIEIHTAYQEYKRKNNILDYDDLLIRFRDFVNDPISNHFLERINFIMVDEFQDTNALQSQIVSGLARLKNNIMAVGDDSQSIYSFRGANFKNIMDFPRLFPDTKVIMLEENYRSTQQILDLANVINKAATEKFEKNLISKRGEGSLPMILAAYNENLQSQFIVERVLELREEGVSLNDMAVLFRSSFFSFDLEIELTKANIPFIKVGGMKFVETAHIKDLIAFLRIAMNPTDFVSWHRILMLHEGIGGKTAQRIINELETGRISIQKPPSEYESNAYVKKLYELFRVLNEIHIGNDTPTQKALKAQEYYYPLFRLNYDDFTKRAKDLDIFLNISEKYETLDTLLTDMAIEPPVESVIDIEEEDAEQEKLTLSTIHSAKGLEWNSVFVIHALDGFFPSTRASERFESLEEERRLMYVAVTRGANNLYISYPMNIYDRETGTVLSKPSRFLTDLTSDLADAYFLQ